MQISHRFKFLLDSYPMNTKEAKKILVEKHGFHPRKLDRWYKTSTIKISVDDAVKLKDFFGLQTIDEVYEMKAPKRKPIKALQK